MTILRALAGAFFLSLSSGVVHAAPPIEAYGALPTVRSMDISPDGDKVVFIRTLKGDDFLITYDFVTGTPTPLSNVSGLKAWGAGFANDRYILMSASKTTQTIGYRGRYEFTATFAYDIQKKKVRQLLRGTEGLHPAQSGLGRVVGIAEGGEKVFMPAYMGTGENPPRNLLKVNLATGRGATPVRGSTHTMDWIVAPDGTVLGREDMNGKRDEYRILTRKGNKWLTLYQENAKTPPHSLHGVNQAGTHLVFSTLGLNDNFRSLYEISLEDGVWRGPLLRKEGHDIARILMDKNRVVVGVEYGGLEPTYGMFDNSVTEDLEALSAMVPGAVVRLDSWTDDWSKLLVYISGTGYSGNFFSYDRKNRKVTPLTDARPDIPREEVRDVLTIEYKARDGLKIPSILTLPKGATPETAKDLPTVIMPHGGPRSHDQVGFDWMAQYFAAQGYLVMQPNFRGSTGFGAAFRNAGDGEWGKKMQHDVTDGVNALVKMGWSDPDRICIVGGSYGGYAALAGGALTPELYKCVVAFGAVTDLPLMLQTERRESPSGHWVYDYWKDRMGGDPRKHREALQAVSPAYNATAFQAPVLLIHGRDDTVVKIDQSRRMERALKKAGKDVTFIVQKNGDHWLSETETRLEFLKATSDFLATHLQ